MKNLEIVEIKGADLVKFIFEMIVQFENPIELAKRVYNSKILVLDFNVDGEDRTGFFLLPNNESQETKDLEQIVLRGIEQGKTSDQLNAEIALFNLKCGNAQ